MKIEQLEYFLAVAQHRNISQASEQLFIGQSTLSTALKNLEKELNFKLFRRTNYGVVLTNKGEQALPVISNIVSEFNQLKALADCEPTQDKISLSLNPLAMRIFLEKILPQLEQSVSLTKIQLKETFSGTVIKEVINNKASIGITAGSKTAVHKAQILAENNNLTIETLKKTEELRVIVAKTHPLAARESVSFSELAEERFALFEGSLPNNALNSSYNRYQDFSHLFLFSNQASLIQAILQHNLVSILPHNVVEQYPDSSLIGIPLTDYDTKLFYYCVYSNKNQLTVAENMCLNYIRQVFHA